MGSFLRQRLHSAQEQLLLSFMDEKQVTIIEAGKRQAHYWKDLFKYRELFYFLAWRDVKVRYKQTVLGITWAVIRPLLTLIIFTFIFGRMAGLPSNGIPYALLVCAGLLPWNFFASAFSESSLSLVSNSNLMTKVYFPRLIIPSGAILVSLLDFFIALVIMLALMTWYSFQPSVNLVFLPLLLLLSMICAMGAGFGVAALNVKYRDFRHIIPFVLQLGLYISPVGFNAAIIPEKWKMLYYLNPMAGIIDGYRWCLLGQPLYINGLTLSVVISLLLFFTGIWYFRKTERSFADVI